MDGDSGVVGICGWGGPGVRYGGKWLEFRVLGGGVIQGVFIADEDVCKVRGVSVRLWGS